MSIWAAIIGMTVGVLTVLSLLLGLRNLVRAFIQDVITRVLVDVGLISQADHPRDEWPNGSNSLPVFLLALWKTQEWVLAAIHDLQTRSNDGND